MKIAFMGTPALAVPCLDALAEHHEIAVVVSQPTRFHRLAHRKQQKKTAFVDAV